MATKLKQLKIDELSLVDSPANKLARVTIFKRSDDMKIKKDDSGEETVTKKDHDDAVAASKKHKDEQDATNARLTKLEADLTTAQALAKLTPEERAACDEDDEEKKKKFLAMSSDERKALISKRQAGDETVVISGVAIKKSVVGEAAFTVMKAQQAQLDENKKAIEKANDEAETAKIEKRVDAEFKHVVGKTEEKALVLKALAKAPDAVRKSFEAILKSAEEMASKGFVKMGSGNGAAEIRKGQQAFNDKVAEIMKRDECNKLVALQKAREEAPEAFEAFQAAGTDAAANAAA